MIITTTMIIMSIIMTDTITIITTAMATASATVITKAPAMVTRPAMPGSSIVVPIRPDFRLPA